MINRLILLSALLCASSVFALPKPKCVLGLGLADPNNPNPYGDPLPGDCLPCQDPNCASCDEDYQKCNSCRPAFGPSNLINCTDYDGCPPTIEKCLPCSSGCGACSLDATQCAAPVLNCPITPIVAATTATQAKWDNTTTCSNPPGSFGNGYLITFTALIQNGTCINCNDKTAWSPDGAQEGFGHRIPPFCDMLSTAQNVAANAFGPSCTNPSLTLYQACHSSRSFPGNWSMTIVFNGTCNGQSMEIAVQGGWTSVLANTSPSNRANVVSEVIQVDPPKGAPGSSDYGDYAPPPYSEYSPSPSMEYNSPSPSTNDNNNSPLPPATSPPVTGSIAPTSADYETPLIPTMNPVSQWTWAAIPIPGSIAPAVAPAQVPVAVAPAPSSGYRAVGSVLGGALVAYVVSLMF